jgi:hypothetical protein
LPLAAHRATAAVDQRRRLGERREVDFDNSPPSNNSGECRVEQPAASALPKNSR